ncbi:hypothetical protein BWP39_09815 [Paraburkholderia acidicola]|uniref:Uncharacterized protein n=1 Tax=Paraburkholderia acidicola TaxID=1912599 RepID=A0A2A4EZM6_9BURK|nr:hypothetical protein BWP39_09815 [Paraburkholderia acidicola]
MQSIDDAPQEVNAILMSVVWGQSGAIGGHFPRLQRVVIGRFRQWGTLKQPGEVAIRNDTTSEWRLALAFRPSMVSESNQRRPMINGRIEFLQRLLLTDPLSFVG